MEQFVGCDYQRRWCFNCRDVPFRGDFRYGESYGRISSFIWCVESKIGVRSMLQGRKRDVGDQHVVEEVMSRPAKTCCRCLSRGRRRESVRKTKAEEVLDRFLSLPSVTFSPLFSSNKYGALSMEYPLCNTFSLVSTCS